MGKLLSPLIMSLAVSATGYGKSDKKHKVKWKQVVELDSEPKNCEFLENVGGDSSGPFVFTNKQGKKKMKQKMQRAAASAGGNAFHVTKTVHEAYKYTFEAKSYWCDALPNTEESKDAVDGDDKEDKTL